MPSSTMINTAGRYALAIFGTATATLAAVGLMSQGDAASAMQAVKDITEAVGKLATSLTILAGFGASLYAGIRGTANDTQANQVAVVAALKDDPNSPVKGVVLEQTIAGRALASDVRSSNPAAGIALAGTDAAATIAKPTEPPPIKTEGKPA